MNQEDTFIMLDEFGKERDATILNIVEIKGKEYVVYSISKNEDEDSIFVSELVKNENGEEEVKSIQDEDERRIVFDVVRELINSVD